MSLQGLPKLMDTFMEQRMKRNLIQLEYQKLVFCFYFPGFKIKLPCDKLLCFKMVHLIQETKIEMEMKWRSITSYSNEGFW